MLDEKELDDFTNDFLADNEEESEGEVVVDKSPDNDDAQPENLSDGSSVWDGATDNQRDEVKNLQTQLAHAQHAASSDRGRNKALHAKVKKLEDNAKTVVSAPNQEQDQGNGTDYTDKELSDMKDDLPEVSAIVNQETAGLKKQLADIESRFNDNQTVEENLESNVQTQESVNAANVEINKVEEAHPKFRDTVNSIDYSTWLSRQPSGVQDMARSPQADNAIAVISMFKSAKNKVDIESKERTDTELESMVDMPHKGLTKSNLIDSDDFDAQFEHFSNQMGG